MLPWIASSWNRLVDGFWFVPGAVALGYAVIALACVRVDRLAGSGGVAFAFQGDAGAARDILATIAGSLITVAGLAFSLTIVVLSLVSSQFSPRAVRGMLADRVNQVVAGSFVGIFAYCLLVLRTVRDETADTAAFVPALSVTVAIGLALLALALLLTFIHRAGTSVQAATIVDRIGRATLEALDRLYPDSHGETVEQRGADLVRTWERSADAHVVSPTRAGYLRAVSLDDVAERLASPGARVHVPVCPGDFVSEETPAIVVWPSSAVDATTARSLQRALVVGEDRDLRQDAAYGIRRLADVALRALSPGINDPTTAETCIEYLAAALERLAERRIPSEVRQFPEHSVVVVARRRTFDEYVVGAYAEIGRYAVPNARVVVAVLAALARIAAVARRAGAVDRLAILLEVGRGVAEPAIEDARTTADRSAVARALEHLTAAAADGVGGPPIAPAGRERKPPVRRVPA